MIYNFTISTDTLNGAVAPEKLSNEIQASTITIAIEGVSLSVDLDSLTIEFKANLSGAEQLELTSVVNAHDGNPGIDDATKFTFVDANGDPLGVVDDGPTKRLALDFGQSTLVGPQGPQGDQGPEGPQGPAGATSVFGTQYQFAKSDAQSSTTSGAYQQKLRLTTNTVPAGNYRVAWSCEAQTTDQDMNIRIQVNDTLTINEFEHGLGSDGDEGGKQLYTPYSGFEEITLTGGIHNIDLDYNDDGGGTARIRRAKLEIWRVS